MTTPAVELAFRRHAAELVAQLTAKVGVARLDLAEDAVQTALLRATRLWAMHGVPDDPRAWLARVARNALTDALRRARVRERGATTDVDVEDDDAAPTAPLRGEAWDDDLRLLFACAHPALTPTLQIPLVLKVGCGFGTAEIAAALLADERAVAQRIVRAKAMLRERGESLDVPGGEALQSRLAAVHLALYLLFNEGYEASSGDAPVRTELVGEALRLVRRLAAHETLGTFETRALAALLCLRAAQLPARTDDTGALLPFAAQDLSRRDGALVAEGLLHLEASMGDALSRWHLEAGIAAAYATAPSPDALDGAYLESQYEALFEVAPSPVVALNLAIARGLSRGPEAALDALDALTRDGSLAGYLWLPAARTYFLLRAGRAEEAEAARAEALRLARTDGQRRALLRLSRD